MRFHEGGTLEPHDVAYSVQRGLLQDRAGGPQWVLLDPALGVSGKVRLIVTGTTVLFGLLEGSVAGYNWGWLDGVLMGIAEIFMAFPFLLAALTMAAVIKSKAPRWQESP